MSVTEEKFSNIEDASSALAEEMAQTIRESISKKGKALIAVSGGKTPRTVFKYLRDQKLNWEKVTITLTDERWVPGDHPESNELLVRSYLLKYLPPEVTFIPFYQHGKNIAADTKACEKKLKHLELPIDAVYLGIGSDGHFASLFPNNKALNISDSLCTAVEGTNSRLPRITLTKTAILDSRKIYILFSGDDKYSAYSRSKIPGSYKELPLRLVLDQNKTPVIIYFAG